MIGPSDTHPPGLETASRARVPWKNFADFYSRLRPPLTPTPSDVDAVRRSLPSEAGRILLLGVTPQLAGLGGDLVAVDNSPKMIAQVWPGDAEDRRALLADWTELPFDEKAFDAVIGDAPLNAAPHHAESVLTEVARVLRRNGRFVFRAFCSPADAESLEAIRSDVSAGWAGNFHALKWRIAMALAGSRPAAIVAVADILAAFDGLFPDRSELARQTGWDVEEVATIDAYVGAEHSLSFPTLQSLVDLLRTRFSDVGVTFAEGYPLAERCPTLVCSAPRDV